jgi:hypothetical protein
MRDGVDAVGAIGLELHGRGGRKASIAALPQV